MDPNMVSVNFAVGLALCGMAVVAAIVGGMALADRRRQKERELDIWFFAARTAVNAYARGARSLPDPPDWLRR